MASKNYTVKATKNGNYWHLDIDGLPQGTQVRRLSEAQDAVADLVGIFTDVPAHDVTVDVRIQLPENVASIRKEADELFEQARTSNALAAERSRQAAKLLKEQGMTLKEIGQALDVSYQRAAQLVSA
ncbi:hypothetical protein [Rothia nasimurium]|uniref:hypothetical protein n=1 Tax=Rothia nasimurium TaxID=85336 RepID=UPI001F1AC8F5|nr:hypothetical protein [Rothia nasimurium]